MFVVADGASATLLNFNDVDISTITYRGGVQWKPRTTEHARSDNKIRQRLIHRCSRRNGASVSIKSLDSGGATVARMSRDSTSLLSDNYRHQTRQAENNDETLITLSVCRSLRDTVCT